MSRKQPSVTVLMSVYNGLPFLTKAIESIIHQTYTDFEFLIIDDASSDGSRDVLREWRDRDERIRLILHEENRGLGYALAEGTKKARTPLVARMDADDIAVLDRLEAQVDYLERNPDVDILGGWAEECDKHGKTIGHRTYPTDHDDIVDMVWASPIIHPTVMFRKEKILAVGGYDASLRKRQDYDLWFRCHEAGHTFANLPKSLIRYRFTDNHFRRNNWRVALDQALIGWRGCMRVNASLVAYIGVAFPLLRSLFPQCLHAKIVGIARSVDPRKS